MATSSRLQDAWANAGTLKSRPSGQRPNIQPGPENNRQILIAVDFGTTYSAVAWIESKSASGAQNDIDRIAVVDEWPGKDSDDKVPTVLQGPELGSTEWRWGFEIDDTEKRLQWFKLEQQPDRYGANKIRQSYPITAIVPTDKNQVEDLVTFYLRCLRSHAEAKIMDSHLGLDNQIKMALSKNIRWEYIITLPAMWPESAHSITERCAKEAGMARSRPVQIITEPEAAGTFALDAMCRDIQLESGDTFVICDAGGGTVDLISYAIIKSAPRPELEEAAPGVGGLCGSTFLDRRFDAWLSDHFRGFSKWNGLYQAEALKAWESEIKRNFRGDESRKELIRLLGLPDDRSVGIKRQNLEVSGSTIKAIFEPIIKQILMLVSQQIDATKVHGRKVKAVLLAGGFGRNDYLKSRIQSHVGHHVKVTRINHSNTAVVRGALLRGLADREPTGAGRPTIAAVVRSRFVRKHYGTTALRQYVAGRDDPNRSRVPGGVDGGQRIEVLEWFISKDSRVKDDEPKEFDFYYDQLVDNVEWNGGRLDKLSFPIYTSEQNPAPKYPDASKMLKLADLPADLNKIERKRLKTEPGSDGRMYYKIWFKIIMQSHLANVRFTLEHEGVQYGTINPVFDTI